MKSTILMLVVLLFFVNLTTLVAKKTHSKATKLATAKAQKSKGKAGAGCSPSVDEDGNIYWCF
jgi:biopolymer transport protein ExbD